MVFAFVPSAGAAVTLGALQSGWVNPSCKSCRREILSCVRPRRSILRMQTIEPEDLEGVEEDLEGVENVDGIEGAENLLASEAVVDAEVSELTTEELKASLLSMANGSNRGAALKMPEREKMLAIIESLESKGAGWVQPEEGSEDPLIGTWRLVYTNALDILSLAVLPVSLGQVYQNVEAGDDDGKYTLYNEVELQPLFAPVTNAFKAFPATSSVIRVTAAGKLTGEVDDPRLDIVFEKSALDGITILGRELSSRLPKLEVALNSPVGYIKTTFIDEDVRIAKAPPTPNAPNQANYFVLLRE